MELDLTDDLPLGFATVSLDIFTAAPFEGRAALE